MTSEPTHARPRIPALDALRGVAVLLVVCYHLTDLEAAGGLATAWDSLTRIGWAGVDVFFVLSGFLITGILLDARAGPSVTAAAYFGRFYRRRVRRIFPLYYATLFALLYAVPLLGPTGAATSRGLHADAAWHWTYLSNWLWLPGSLPHAAPTAAHFWSLAIEEQFYLVWPLVVWATPARRLPWVCAAIALGSLLLRCAVLVATGRPEPGYHLTVTRVDALAIGALLAVLVRQVESRDWLRAHLPHVARVSLYGTLLAVTLGRARRYGPFMSSAGYTMLALGAAGVIAIVTLAPEVRLARTLAGARRLRWFGTVSYGLYVFHYPVRALLRAYGVTVPALAARWGSPWLAQLAFYALAGGGATLLAAASWRWFERPILEGRLPRPGARVPRSAAAAP